jgi:hypothetical protein
MSCPLSSRRAQRPYRRARSRRSSTPRSTKSAIQHRLRHRCLLQDRPCPCPGHRPRPPPPPSVGSTASEAGRPALCRPIVRNRATRARPSTGLRLAAGRTSPRGPSQQAHLRRCRKRERRRPTRLAAACLQAPGHQTPLRRRGRLTRFLDRPPRRCRRPLASDHRRRSVARQRRSFLPQCRRVRLRQ